MGRSRKEIEDLYGPDAPDDIEYWDKMDRLYGDHDDDEDDMPLCCQTCGGRSNYPDCTDSCKIFDE